MDPATFIVVGLVIATALIFDFTNGFHDTANAMATSIATGALAPKTAVIAAGTLNLVGAFLSTEVAKTISGGIINEQMVTIGPEFILAGLIGAIIWNLVTWLVGLPSSSSHALFGGLVGAVIVGAGVEGVNFGAVVAKVLVPALVSPLVAGFAAFVAVRLIFAIVRKMDESQVENGFRHGQTITACLVALSHGTNDAQKTMGIITLTLIAVGAQPSAGAGALGCGHLRFGHCRRHLHGRLARHPHAGQGLNRNLHSAGLRRRGCFGHHHFGELAFGFRAFHHAGVLGFDHRQRSWQKGQRRQLVGCGAHAGGVAGHLPVRGLGGRGCVRIGENGACRNHRGCGHCGRCCGNYCGLVEAQPREQQKR